MEVLDQLFIPEIANIIRDYTYPDYRKMFDVVVRDIDLVAGYYVKELLVSGTLHPQEGVSKFSTLTLMKDSSMEEWEELFAMIRCPPVESHEVCVYVVNICTNSFYRGGLSMNLQIKNFEYVF